MICFTTSYFWNKIVGRRAKYSEKKPYQCHIVSRKSHTDHLGVTRGGLPPGQAGDKKAWIVERPHKWNVYQWKRKRTFLGAFAKLQKAMA
jgi:hypothetical protein